MSETAPSIAPVPGGIQLYRGASRDLEDGRGRFLADLEEAGVHRHVRMVDGSDAGGPFIRFLLTDQCVRDWVPGFDTTGLCRTLALDTHGKPADLDREILVAMLAAPIAFPFPGYGELASAVRIRKNIVRAGRRTALAFDTEEAERPDEYWTYSEERGFTVRPGKSLILALEKATQPDRSGRLYSFSCYRATEYVMLLGIAQELAVCNPELLDGLQRQWETRALMSTPFHDVFLREYGTLGNPLPQRYYVPGDRLWFRNPDEPSSNVEGYEGSWVFYLGEGLFTNFWKRDQPFTLATKCVELFHWRNATFRGGDGALRVDDELVDEKVRQSLRDPAEVEGILRKMLRLRDPGNTYLNGGCIDATREYARYVRPGTSDLVFPG